MNYSTTLATYKETLERALRSRDRQITGQCLLSFRKFLLEMAENKELSMMQAMKLKLTAERYGEYAALVSEYGLPQLLVEGIRNASDPKKAEEALRSSFTDKTAHNTQNPFRKFSSASTSSPVKKSETQSPRDTAKAPSVSDDWEVDVFEKNLSATVVVMTETGQGTGFFISADGLILTNHHVISHKGKIEKSIRIQSGDKKINCKARYIASDADADVALLKAETGTKRTQAIAFVKDYSRVRQAEKVLLIGNALGEGLSPVLGIIKHTREEDWGDLIYSALSNHGDSGSPVLNRRGECVGIHKSATVKLGDEAVRGYSRATPADRILRLVSKWKSIYNL